MEKQINAEPDPLATLGVELGWNGGKPNVPIIVGQIKALRASKERAVRNFQQVEERRMAENMAWVEYNKLRARHIARLEERVRNRTVLAVAGWAGLGAVSILAYVAYLAINAVG